MSQSNVTSGNVGTALKEATDLEAASGSGGQTYLRDNIRTIANRIRYLLDTGGLQSAISAFIGDTANAKSTLGLTINQGAADDEILTLKSSDVAHGVTDLTETDSFGFLKKAEATSGGLVVGGIKDSDGIAGSALVLQGVIGEPADTAKSTSAVGIVSITTAVKSGTGTGISGADSNLVAVQDGSGSTRFILDVEGSGHADVAWTTF